MRKRIGDFEKLASVIYYKKCCFLLKISIKIAKNICKNNPVAKEFELGQKVGVRGTPTMLLENGVRMPGLVDAKDLVKIIKDQAQ